MNKIREDPFPIVHTEHHKGGRPTHDSIHWGGSPGFSEATAELRVCLCPLVVCGMWAVHIIF